MVRKYQSEEESKKATQNALLRYRKKATTTFHIRYHNVYDAQIIDKLKSQDNKTDYIRQLIKKDIEK